MRHTLGRTRLRAAAAIALALVVGVPTAVVAGHRFGDVPTGSAFHDDVEALAASGITSGCREDPPRYCGGAAVNRGQMAAFLNRGLSRAAFGANVAALSADNDHVGAPATLAVEAGGAGSGTGYVVLHGSVTVYAEGDLSACPCEVEAAIVRLGDGGQGPSSWAQLPAQAASTGVANVAVPVSWAVPIRAAARETYALAVGLNGAAPAADVTAEASLTALYAPLGVVEDLAFAAGEDGRRRARDLATAIAPDS